MIAQHNFPTIPQLEIPVLRLGFDIRQLLQNSVSAIVARRDDEPTPAAQLLSAQFDHELVTPVPVAN